RRLRDLPGLRRGLGREPGPRGPPDRPAGPGTGGGRSQAEIAAALRRGVTDRHARVAVAGAGLAGIGMSVALDRAGIEHVLFERAGGLGGTWRDNGYPGCACDVPTPLYSYSFAPNPDWSRLYAPRAEILEYVEGVARVFGVRDRIRFEHRVEEACW